METHCFLRFGWKIYWGERAHRKYVEVTKDSTFVSNFNLDREERINCCCTSKTLKKKGSYQFHAAPRAGRGYSIWKCSKCHHIVVKQEWMS